MVILHQSALFRVFPFNVHIMVIKESGLAFYSFTPRYTFDV